MLISKKALSSKIKKLRKLNNLTQEHLSEMIDITQRQLVRIEAGTSYPSIETLWKLAKTFQVNVSYFLTATEGDDEGTILKSELNDILTLAKIEQLKLIKKLTLAVLES